MSEKEKFTQHVRELQKNGLVGMHVTANPNAVGKPSEEEIFGELNRMIEAPDLPDPEVLGSYSPPLVGVKIPNPPTLPAGCFCYEDCTYCVCKGDEIYIRAWVAGKLPPMTAEHREWCLTEIAKVEGFTREAYATSPDDQLARGVLSSWLSYCRDKGLL